MKDSLDASIVLYHIANMNFLKL